MDMEKPMSIIPKQICIKMKYIKHTFIKKTQIVSHRHTIFFFVIPRTLNDGMV